MSVDVFVLSACSGDKEISPPDLDCEEIDESSRTDLLDAYPDASLPAKSLYTGNEHTHVKTAVEELSKIAEVDWRIISAGFGLVRPETELPSYECAFNDDDAVQERAEQLGHDTEQLTKAEQRRAIGDDLGIPSALEETFAHGYDIAFVVLGEDYLHATGTALSSIPEKTTAFAFAPEGNNDLIGDCSWVRSTDEERDAHSTTWMQVKGRLLRTMTEHIATSEELAGLKDPEVVRELGLPAT